MDFSIFYRMQKVIVGKQLPLSFFCFPLNQALLNNKCYRFSRIVSWFRWLTGFSEKGCYAFCTAFGEKISTFLVCTRVWLVVRKSLPLVMEIVNYSSAFLRFAETAVIEDLHEGQCWSVKISFHI